MKPAKQEHYLLSSRQYKQVYEKGRRISNAFFTAFVVPTETTFQRLGLTTTRKLGNAVLRNRCRRRLREVFRHRNRELLRGRGYDLVLNVRSPVANAEFGDLVLAFEQLLNRIQQSVVWVTPENGEP